MNNCEYYSKLANIDFLKIHPNLIPFVGEDYEQYRILQIGESHYLNQQPNNIRYHIEDFLVDWWEKPCNELLTGSEGWVDTCQVVNRFMDNEKGSYTIFSNTLRSFCSIVLDESNPHIIGTVKKKYNYFSFMNFYQMPSLIEGKKYWDSLEIDNKLKASEMWNVCAQKSNEVVDATIDILNPRMIVFTSFSAGEAYRDKGGKYSSDKRVVYTSHPQAPFSWCKPLEQLAWKTGKEKFEDELKKIYK